MNWKRWKMSALVAGITSILTATVIALSIPSLTWKGFAIAFILNFCKDAALWLKDHPIEQVKEEYTENYK